MSEPERPVRASGLGLLPLPEKRRKRLVPFIALGVVALGAGYVLDIGFVWGLGLGMILTAVVAMLLDRWARRRQQA